VESIPVYDALRIDDPVRLHAPIMVIGLSGWGNAGDVATFSTRYLAEQRDARRFGEIRAEGFHDYFIHRPVVVIEGGVIRAYQPPRNELFYARQPDLVILRGVEPHLNWPRYTAAVLDVATTLAVTRIYTIGGYLAEFPHDADPPVTASTNADRLTTELTRLGLQLNDYRGPTSVYSDLLWRARGDAIDIVSLWCPVSLHVHGRSQKAAYAVLQTLSQLIGLRLDLAGLQRTVDAVTVEADRDTTDASQMDQLMETLRRTRDREPTYIR
jgi:proteasome assembly chaperone (PAC2) family protein